MSSTTDPRRGQVLAIFALSLVVLMLVAALAFDVGSVLVAKRDQQNAADAAAIAGARYLPANEPQARAAAEALAADNGFATGAGSQDVVVNIPPLAGPFAGQAGYIEVLISDNRPAIFAGVISIFGWDVGVRAVAANQPGIGAPFAMLALHPDDCGAITVTGSGTVLANGNIQVNSECPSPGALRRTGTGVITVTAPNAACNVVGGIQNQGAGALNCVQNPGAAYMDDPLLTLPEPPVPALAPAAVPVGATGTPPAGCPGSATPATWAAPAVCQFQSSYAGTVWRLYPGLYPGGIKLQGGTFYLEPGIYYLGGGGLEITGNGTVTRSVEAGGTTLGGGVMFFNTDAPAAAGPITLNGAQANINLHPVRDTAFWDGIVIFQDRDVSINGDDVTINGGSSDMDVRGTIYVPAGDVKVNGSSGTMTVDQVIASTFMINGGGGTVRVLNDQDFVFTFKAAGLVE